MQPDGDQGKQQRANPRKSAHVVPRNGRITQRVQEPVRHSGRHQAIEPSRPRPRPHAPVYPDTQPAARAGEGNQPAERLLAILRVVQDPQAVHQIECPRPEREMEQIRLQDANVGSPRQVGVGRIHGQAEVHADHPASPPLHDIRKPAHTAPHIED